MAGGVRALEQPRDLEHDAQADLERHAPQVARQQLTHGEAAHRRHGAKAR